MFPRPYNLDNNDSALPAKRAGRVSAEGIGLWTAAEHERFLTAVAMYPTGPWRLVADYVGTRNARQTMTHAHKYKQKLARRTRGLRPSGRAPGRRRHQEWLTISEILHGERSDSSAETGRVAGRMSSLTNVSNDHVVDGLSRTIGTGLSSHSVATDINSIAWSTTGFETSSTGEVDVSDLALEDDIFQLLVMEMAPAGPVRDTSAEEDTDEASLNALLGMAF